MEAWEHIVHTALLGTDKKQPDVKQWPAALAEPVQLLSSFTDKEEQFLQTAALVFNFRQCGILPLHKEGINFPAAAQEEKNYCSAFASQILKDILELHSTSLLELWLELCAAKQLIVQPDMAPLLLEEGVSRKHLQKLIMNCCGKRGEWLSRFNNDWNYFAAASLEQLWDTGTPEQRREALVQMRRQDAALAREWLQNTWPQEDANSKVKLLEALDKNVTAEDVPFLETLLAEKGKKVKDAATELLKQHPDSSIVKLYEQVLRQAAIVKKEKTFFGISKQGWVQIALPPDIDENIFKTGIEKLSSTKEISDEDFILMQLAEAVPLTFWEEQLQRTPEQIIHTFQKHKVGKHLVKPLVKAITKFKDERWAIAFMQHSEVFFIDIIPFLPIRQQEHYSLKSMSQHGDNLIHYAIQREDEWGNELSKAILKFTARNTYRYDRGFYNLNINHFPVSMSQELERFMPAEEYLRGHWSSMSDHIIRLLTLKSQTLKAFNE